MGDFSWPDPPGQTAFPIARPGWPMIVGAAFVTAVFAVLDLTVLALAGLVVTFCICGFFRDPDRVVPTEPGAVVSPADGKVLEIAAVTDNRFNQGACQKISIFMSVFNVHVNRIPCAGVVRQIDYCPGKFFSANLDKASRDNEQNAILLETDPGKMITVVQIAGLIARRIISGLQVGNRVDRGQRFGMDEHRQIRLGYRPAPKSADKHRTTPIQNVMDEYLAWGRAQGGRHNHPWGKDHARHKTELLKWWRNTLNLGVLADLDDVLPRVEAALRELQAAGRSGRTVQGYREVLSSFCFWAERRGYLLENPLKNSVGFDRTPKTRRRALTADEVESLLNHCTAERRFLYEVALCSGLRAKELRSLQVKHLDVAGNGLHLDAEWTKNRRSGFQPIPAWLVEKLQRATADKDPEMPLLDIPVHSERTIRDDLAAAGIPKWTPEGKVDFHALRVTFATMVIESGANVKEAQSLLRHATPDLTMNVYAKTRQNQLANVAEGVGAAVHLGEKYAQCRTKLAAGAELQGANDLPCNGLRVAGKWSGRADLNRRPLRPERSALSKLSHAPSISRARGVL